MSAVSIAEHGPYTLKAMQMKGQKVVTARAFHTGGPPGIVAEAQGPTVDAALDTLRLDLDSATEAAAEETAREKASRREIDGVMVPTTPEFARALEMMKIAPRHWEMLRAHASAGEAGLTPGDLAYAAGYKNFAAANLQYGRLGYTIADYLGDEAFLARFKANKRGAIVLLAVHDGAAAGDGRWTMHPELVAAVTA